MNHRNYPHNNGNGITALHLAAHSGNLSEVTDLLYKGYSASLADFEGNTPLHFVQQPHIALLLIQAGANPLYKNHDGKTPLDNVRNKGLHECARVMIDNTCLETMLNSLDISPTETQTQKYDRSF